MDAHIFRRLAFRLSLLLPGQRIEKIYTPAPEILVFALSTIKERSFLSFCWGPRFQGLFTHHEKPVMPASPAPNAMLLRKHFGGRRILSLSSNWPERRLLVSFFPSTAHQFSHLLLAMRQGFSLLAAPPVDFSPPLCWPTESPHAFQQGEQGWKKYPCLTPLLRKTLLQLDEKEGAALLADLRSECEHPETEGKTWGYVSNSGHPPFLCAWPLPESMKAALEESSSTDSLSESSRIFSAWFFEHLTCRQVTAGSHKNGWRQRRLERALPKLEAEKRRFAQAIEKKKDALSIQSCLSSLNAEEKREELIIDQDMAGKTRRIALDPRLTIKENMLTLFQSAAKAQRGLRHIAKRETEIKEALINLRTESLPREGCENTPLPFASAKKQERTNALASPTMHSKKIARFFTSDGFVALRGRDAKGNREVLKTAAPHDLWFHCEDGPSAHLILRRAHALQDVPETSLYEAASLVAIKSWRKQDAHARVMYALASDVRSPKGSPDGKVIVQKRRGCLDVPVDPTLEDRLAERVTTTAIL